MRLAAQSLSRLDPAVRRFAYQRDAQAAGIVHFGIGAFHRAHQAAYTDACMNAGESGWMIAGVSLRSPAVADQLNPQDGLYTLTERSGSGTETRVIGAVGQVLVAGRDTAAINARIADPACRIVSFTMTEKGYCRDVSGNLDLIGAEQGFYLVLTAALRARANAGLPGLTLLSCDNLADNGRVLGRLIAQWLDARAPDLAPWFAAECRTPGSMVDRIVPATTQDNLTELERCTGVSDRGAVFTEPFSQWVVEDDFAGPRPRWEEHGVQIVGDVTPYEVAKLRMLNGAHSLLAYCGLWAGHSFVHEAIADPALGTLVTRLMREEAVPTITAGVGQDLTAYAYSLIRRFENPALNHSLRQIAMDGSQKIPQRWLATLAENQRHGRECLAILTAIAAWIVHLRGTNGPVDDPLAHRLSAAASSDDPTTAIFGPGGPLASDWHPTGRDLAAISAALGH